MENITGEKIPPENANFSILATHNFIGQATLRCSEILREWGEKLSDWGIRQI